MVYDPSRKQIVLYGAERSSERSSTWTWDGTTWTELAIESPPYRHGAAMTFDEARQQVLMFGGDAHGATSETWAFRDGTWALLEPVASPSPRYGASLGYDPISQTVIMFGGIGFLADTWSFDGTTWINRSTSKGPYRRYLAKMAYDESRGQLVLFGGVTVRLHETRNCRMGYACHPRSTWAWNGSKWAPLRLDRLPPGRNSFGMTTLAGRPTLTGGSNVAGRLHDVWTLGEAGWRRSHDIVPPISTNMEFAWDAARKEAIFFGGFTDDVEWSNETWSVTR